MELFNPPYCPNESCDKHQLGGKWSVKTFYYRNGFYLLRGERKARFRCKFCGHYFSERAFHFDFRFKKADPTLSCKILQDFIVGACNRQIARKLYISDQCVRTRLSRMAEQAMLIHREKLTKLRGLDEGICYDGLQNFAISQYHPNYINQAIGKESHFVFDFNFAPLLRAGRMSDRQKLKKELLDRNLGTYPKNAIRMATTELFSRLLELHSKYSSEQLVLFTDEHYEYRRSLRYDLDRRRFVHKTVSAKKHRDFQNILFPVNHADLMSRHQVAAFKRDTIAFSKTHAKMCQKYMLFMTYKNYFCPQFTKKLKSRPQAHELSPAQLVGIEKKILKFHEFFCEKRTQTQVRLPKDWQMIINGQVPYPRQKVAA